MKYLVVLLFPLYLFGNDTLNVKTRFVFSNTPTEHYKEPKFLEIIYENRSNEDLYFVLPFMRFYINDVDSINVSLMAGRLDLRKDITEYYFPYQKEIKSFRKKLRENLYSKNISSDIEDFSEYLSVKNDEHYAELNWHYFLRKGEEVTFRFFISSKLDSGNYKFYIRSQDYPDRFYQYFPSCFKGYKFFKGNFKLDYPFEFRVE